MADDVQNLQVTITATDAGASAVLADVRTKIAAIETELGGMGVAGAAAGQGVAAGFQVVADKAAVARGGLAGVSGAAKETRGALSDMNELGGNAARAFSALGLEGGAAASRVGALTGALGSMAGVAPELIGALAALGVAMAVFDFFKQGVADAMAFQAEMSTTSSAIRAQGGDWSALEGQIKSFIATESLASGFTQNELAASLNDLVTSLSGVESSTEALSDSEKILGVAEETAIAKHRELSDVTNMLKEAEAGRGMALAQLDPRLKEIIHDHGTLDQVLQILHADNKTQVTDTDAAATAQLRMHAAYAAVGQELGTAVLPAITQLSTLLIGSIPAIEDVAKALGDGLGGSLKIIAGGAMASWHALVAMFDAANHDIKGAQSEGAAAMHSLGDMGKGFAGATVGWMVDLSHAASDYSKAYVTAEHDIAAAIKKHIDALKDLNTSFNPKLGMEPGGDKGSGFTPPVLTDATQQNKLETAAEAENADTSDRLADAKDKATLAEGKLAVAIKLTTTISADQNAQNALAQQKIKDLGEQYGVLNEAIYNETRMKNADVVAQSNAQNTYHAASSALADFTQKHKGEKDMSESDKETLELLKTAVENAKSAFDDAKASVRSLTSTIRDHREESARDAAAQYELQHAAEIAAAAAQKAWDTFTTDEQNKMQDDLATFQKTNAQKVAYYANAIAQMGQVSAANLEQMKSDYSAEESAFKAMMDEQVSAYKAALDKETSMTSTFLDDLLNEHKSFRDEFKSIMDSMVKDYLDGVSKMLVGTEQHPGPLQGLAQFFGAPSAPTETTQMVQASTDLQQGATELSTVSTGALPQAAQALSNSATQLNSAAQHLGGGSGTASSSSGPNLTGGQQIATYPTPSGAAIVTYTGGVDAEEISSDVNKAGGTTTPVAGDTMTSYFTPGADGSMQIGFSGAAAAALSSSSSSSPWGVGINPVQAPWGWGQAPGAPSGSPVQIGDESFASPTAAAGAMLQQAMMGYMMGQSVNQMMYPNELPGQGFTAGIGGALGDIGGSMVAGPVGGFIGSILGSLIGGIFGPHETAAEEPDVSEPSYGSPWSYGQFVSNMIGTYGTYNGQTIQAQQGYNVYEGGTPMGQQVYSELADLPKNLSPVVEGLASQLRALEDGDTNVNALEIKSQSQGMFTLESGAQISVQSYMQMMGQFMAATAGMLPTYTLSRTYPNFNKSTLSETGEYDPTLNYGPLAPGQKAPPYYNQPGYPNGPNGAPNAQQGPVEVSIKVNGLIVTSKDISGQLALAISQALQRLNIGTSPGGLTERMGTGVAGGDW